MLYISSNEDIFYAASILLYDQRDIAYFAKVGTRDDSGVSRNNTIGICTNDPSLQFSPSFRVPINLQKVADRSTTQFPVSRFTATTAIQEDATLPQVSSDRPVKSDQNRKSEVGQNLISKTYQP